MSAASKVKPGRRKVKVEKIVDERSRQATFQKRKQGLIKKAMELSLLCDAEVALVIFGAPTATCKTGKLSQYSSRDVDLVLTKFVDAVPHEVYTNQDYERFTQKGGKASDDESEVVPVHSAASNTPMELHRALNALGGAPGRVKESESTASNNGEAAGGGGRKRKSGGGAAPDMTTQGHGGGGIPRLDSDQFPQQGRQPSGLPRCDSETIGQLLQGGPGWDEAGGSELQRSMQWGSSGGLSMFGSGNRGQ